MPGMQCAFNKQLFSKEKKRGRMLNRRSGGKTMAGAAEPGKEHIPRAKAQNAFLSLKPGTEKTVLSSQEPLAVRLLAGQIWHMCFESNCHLLSIAAKMFQSVRPNVNP